MNKEEAIHNAINKALGIEETVKVEKTITKKVKTTNEVVELTNKKLIIEDGRELLT